MSININIVSPASEFPFQKLLSPDTVLVEFKRRIELVVGIYAADMRLTLLDPNGKFVGDLNAEGQTLGDLGVKNGFTVKVEDRTGAMKTPFKDDIEHYKIDSENYSKREDSARNFVKSYVAPHIQVGNRCVVSSKARGDRLGTIAYIGEVDFKPEEVMVGVVFDEAVGKHDGSVDGKRYFECENGYGVFAERKNVKPAPRSAKPKPAPVAEPMEGIMTA